jgi:phage tail sheath protein FI
LVSYAEQASVIGAAQRFCQARQAFLIVDPPPPSAAMTNMWPAAANAVPIDDIGTSDGMTRLQDWATQLVNPASDACAVYYPWVQIPDPWNNLVPRYVPPSGSVAGVYASTDLGTGVWQAPAGTAAKLAGVTGLADPTMTDAVSNILNPRGINSLRTFAGDGTVVWGARTLASQSNVDFTYVSVRRLFDFIQQSLQQSFTWTVFEPNGPLLWSSLAVVTNAFLTKLWSEGALFGDTASQAFSVSCDATTTSVADIKAGIVNISVACAPVRAAEFVSLNVPLRAGAPDLGSRRPVAAQ